MTDVNGRKREGARARCGAQALSLLATQPNGPLLRMLAEEPGTLTELRRRGGWPASTLRARLRELAAVGLIERSGRSASGGSARYRLTEAGEAMLEVVGVLERWLEGAPEVERPLGGDGAKAAIRAMVDGWSAGLVRALASRPLSVAEVDGLIASMSYPTLERRIAAMRLVGQVEARANGSRETPYAATEWLRRGVAPLLAAIRWERLHAGEGRAAVAGIDLEAVFLLTLPLIELEENLAGRCRLVVELSKGSGHRLAGAVAGFEGGALGSCISRLDGEVDAWASGPLSAWLDALIDGATGSLELGGHSRLARAVVTGLHRALSGAGAGEGRSPDPPSLAAG